MQNIDGIRYAQHYFENVCLEFVHKTYHGVVEV